MKKLLILTILILIPLTAYPCSFKEKSDQEKYDTAISVFHAKITETKLSLLSNPENPKETVEVVEGKFKVIENFKNEPPKSGFVRDLVFGPGNCSLGLSAGLEYVFYVSEEFDFVLLPSGSFSFFNREGTEVKPMLEKLKKLSNEMK